jgi:hypothetical protein
MHRCRYHGGGGGEARLTMLIDRFCECVNMSALSTCAGFFFGAVPAFSCKLYYYDVFAGNCQPSLRSLSKPKW